MDRPERLRRLGLALGHAQDAGAHDLGDEARRVDGEAEQQRHQLGQDGDAALEIEAAQLGIVEARAELPAARKATSGSPMIASSDGQNTGKRWPVSACRRRAHSQRPMAASTPTAKAMATGSNPGCGTGAGR